MLHADPVDGGVDLVTIDVAWTRQSKVIPAALPWLRAGGRIVTLVKPHYEAPRELLTDGALAPEDAATTLDTVLAAMPELGVRVVASTTSPVTGAKSSRKRRGSGNTEFLVLLERL